MTNESLFFGREAILQRLSRDVFFVEKGFGRNLALCGPHGIGKSYLIRRLIRQFNAKNAASASPREFCFYMDIKERGNAASPLIRFQNDLLSRMADKIKEPLLRQAAAELDPDGTDFLIQDAVDYLLDAYALPEKEPNPDDPGYSLWCSRIHRCMEPDADRSIFVNYTLLGIRVILVLDEFDRAAKAYPEGDIFHWLFSLSNKSVAGSELNLSVIHLSRQRPGLIAHHMEESSNYEDAYPTIILCGFNNRDLDEYFASYQALPCGVPDETEKSNLLYLCGRHPGLLMKMRTEYEAPESVGKSVMTVWKQNAASFNTVYEKLCSQMENAKLSSLNDLSLLDALLYQFEYFTTTAEDGGYEEKLVSAGFAISYNGDTASSEYIPGIFELCHMEGDGAANTSPECEPISPYFLDYVRKRWQPNRQRGAADFLAMTEQQLRDFLRETMKAYYGDSWKQRVENVVSGKKNRYLLALNREMTLNGVDDDTSLLDVIAFYEYVALIQQNWDNIYAARFSAYSSNLSMTQNRLSDDFQFLTACRNLNAHGNIRILSPASVQRLEDICERLNRVMAAAEA